jgi:acetyl esterase
VTRRTALQRVGHRAWYDLTRSAMGLPPGVLRRLTKGNAPLPDGVTIEPSMALVVAAQRWERQRRLSAPHDVDLARRRMRRNTVGLQGRPTAVAAVRDCTVPGPAGEIRVRSYLPFDHDRGRAKPLLVFFHGGGFALGDLDTHDEPCRLLCRYADVHVLAVDYRCAPEHPFPAGLDDAWSGYGWALAHAAELGADPTRVLVGGDSAGANLATVVCQLAAASGRAIPYAQLLLYPPTHHWGDYASRRLFADGYLLSEADIDWFHEAYVGHAGRTDDPRRSPLLAPDLSHQPPAVVVTAELDPLRDEGEAYADAVARAGVRVVDRRASGMLHGFFSMTTISRAARAQALATCGDLRELLDRLDQDGGMT